jgi:Domain of unknown function (DUF4105)
MRQPLRGLTRAAAWSIIGLLNPWAATALYIDLRVPALRLPVTLLYALGIVTILTALKRDALKAALCLAAFCLVLAWWASLQPSTEGPWQPGVDRTAWAQITGTRATIHNLRNCDYRSETDFTDCWSDRTVDLVQLRSLDLFLIEWGLPFTGHAIASFQFGDQEHIAFSIEPRLKAAQSFSAASSFFRQYQLIFVAGDERDLVRLRTSFRKHEEVFLFRTQIPPDEARNLFLTYLEYLNQLHRHSEWYNALTRNCTTTMSRQIVGTTNHPPRWTSRFEPNTSFGKLLYNRGRLVTGNLSFEELKSREHINAAARSASQSAAFSALIRAGRVGF